MKSAPIVQHRREPVLTEVPSSLADTAVPLAGTVYFIASHTNPAQVARLAHACLSSGNPRSRVLIHHNADVSHLDPASVLPLGNVDLLPPYPGMNRESFASCAMLRGAIEWALSHRDFTWFVNLSGQDYPIKPLAQMERELAATPYDGFVLAKPVEQCQWHTGIGRYYYRYFDAPRLPGWGRIRRYLKTRATAQVAAGNRYPRFVIPSIRHGSHKIGVRPLRALFNTTFQCYFGSVWWMLNRRALESMMRTLRRRPDILRHYQRTLWAPTESLFATLVMNDPSLNICTLTDKRFISWSNPETGRPDLLTMDDWDRLMASDAYFARKISEASAPELLDRLDQHIGVM